MIDSQVQQFLLNWVFGFINSLGIVELDYLVLLGISQEPPEIAE